MKEKRQMIVEGKEGNCTKENYRYYFKCDMFFGLTLVRGDNGSRGKFLSLLRLLRSIIFAYK